MLAQQPRPERLRLALSHTPSDASKWTRLGVALRQQDPEASTSAFRRAVACNAFASDAFLGLAQQAESKKDKGAAESFYLKASQSSRRLKPVLALAAFYARNGRMDDFWRTARAAAAIDKADVESVFRLAEETGANPNLIPSLLDLKNGHALTTYIRLSAAENRPLPLVQAAMRLPATAEHQPAILLACDRLIEAGAAEAAVELWNRLGSFPKLDAAGGRSLTNPSFAPSAVTGFNWRLGKNSGVDIRHMSPGLSIEFSGGQRQQVLLLEQIVPLLPNRKYRLSVDTGTPELSTAEGLEWAVQCMPWRETIASAPAIAAEAGTSSLTFSTPAGCNLGSTMLAYSRKPGTVRISGTLSLHSAALELLP